MKFKFSSKFTKDEVGQDLVEYTLILVVISLIVVAVFSEIGQHMSDAMWFILGCMQGGACS